MTIGHRELADGLLPAVLAAARIELEHLKAGVDVETKADATPVTIADRLAEAEILKALAIVAPDIPVVAEEEVSAGRIPEVSDEFFLVDALDGTRSFIKGEPDFTINVARVREGKPEFGLIMLPARGELYVTRSPSEAVRATVDVGAVSERAPCRLEDFNPKPVQTRAGDAAHLTVALSNSHRSSRLEQRLEGVAIRSRVEAGSSLKFCRLAEGKADFYPRLGSICEWDIAAGHAILRAAGGDVTEWDGSALSYGDREGGFRTPAFVAWGDPTLIGRVSLGPAQSA